MVIFQQLVAPEGHDGDDARERKASSTWRPITTVVDRAAAVPAIIRARPRAQPDRHRPKPTRARPGPVDDATQDCRGSGRRPEPWPALGPRWPGWRSSGSSGWATVRARRRREEAHERSSPRRPRRTSECLRGPLTSEDAPRHDRGAGRRGVDTEVVASMARGDADSLTSILGSTREQEVHI